MGETWTMIDRFRDLRVAVVGEAMLDTYLEGAAERVCQEAPVPIVDLHRRRHAAGGAANAAVNLAGLGARVRLISVVGDDPEADALCRTLASGGVRTAALVRASDRRTITKSRVVADGQVLLRIDSGTSSPLDGRRQRQLVRRLERAFAECDAVVVSDYARGMLTPAVIDAITRLRRDWPGVLCVDARDLSAYREARPTLVKPNFDEVVRLLDLEDCDLVGDRTSLVCRHAARVLEVTGAQHVAVTLDRDGAVVLRRGERPVQVVAAPVGTAYPAGAGDTFVSAATVALASGASIGEAARLASAAAGIVVSQPMTAACTLEELRLCMKGSDSFVPDVDCLVETVSYHRRQGRRIVFTNGCFDILHRGHITYLRQARALGDVLVVALNGDDGIRRLKGPGRPINSFDDRVHVLSALECIDYIVGFDDDTPVELIRKLRPDVFVKGGDYEHRPLAEAPVLAELGVEVRIMPYVSDRSTTRIIDRITTDAGTLDRREHDAPPAEPDEKARPHAHGHAQGVRLARAAAGGHR